MLGLAAFKQLLQRPVVGPFKRRIDFAGERVASAPAAPPLALGVVPGPGQFSISVALTSISFAAPAPIAPGTYFVRLRVNGVEGPAVGRIALP